MVIRFAILPASQLFQHERHPAVHQFKVPQASYSYYAGKEATFSPAVSSHRQLYVPQKSKSVSDQRLINPVNRSKGSHLKTPKIILEESRYSDVPQVAHSQIPGQVMAETGPIQSSLASPARRSGRHERQL